MKIEVSKTSPRRRLFFPAKTFIVRVDRWMDGRMGDNLGSLIYFLRYTKVCKLLLRSIIEYIVYFYRCFFLGGRGGGIPKKSVYERFPSK